MAAGGGRRSVRKTGARAPEAGRQTANSSGRFVATKFSFGACPSTSVEPTICRQQGRAKRAAQRISSAFARARRGARTCVDLTAHARARYHRRRSRRPLRKRKCAARGCSPQPACPACVCGASSHGPGPADTPAQGRAGFVALCSALLRGEPRHRAPRAHMGTAAEAAGTTNLLHDAAVQVDARAEAHDARGDAHAHHRGGGAVALLARARPWATLPMRSAPPLLPSDTDSPVRNTSC